MIEADFIGFKSELFDFLCELTFNNNKAWFDLNRDRYKELFKEPMDLLAQKLIKEVNNFNSDIDFIYSVSRINRDVRFSKNKEPYRNSKWITIKTNSGTCKHLPVLFFELMPSGYTYGMGIYCTKPDLMAAYRKRIDSNINEISRLIQTYKGQKKFLLEGDMYKRKLSEYDGDIAQWYQLKDFALICNKEINESIFDGSVVDEVIEGFKALMPFFKYWYEISQTVNQ